MISAKDYARVTNFLRRYKIVHGAVDLNATLRRHYRLADALREYEKKTIIDLEGEI